jgi:hypothetical protein
MQILIFYLLWNPRDDNGEDEKYLALLMKKKKIGNFVLTCYTRFGRLHYFSIIIMLQ